MTNPIHPPVTRARAFMRAREISRNFSGGPSLLVSSGLASVDSVTSDFGFDTIFVTVKNTDVHFFRDAHASTANDFVEIFQLPADLLAIVATPDDAAQLSALWSERGLVSPPIIAVKNAVEAIGPILARARAEMTAVSARCTELQSALVATRAEFEETRVAMHGLMRTLSYRYATKKNLVAVAAPAPCKTTKLEASGTLRQIYPVATESVTCLALHIADIDLNADAVLKVVLLGAESGRVLGEWWMPGQAVLIGWNIFDLPVPVAAVRETIELQVTLDAAAGGAVTFSLAEDATTGRQSPLSIRIWTADPGGRFPHAGYWVWNVLGEVRLPAGTVSLVAADAIGCITTRGCIEALSKNSEEPAATYLLRGGSSLLRLPDLAIRDAEGICVELGLGHGDLRDTRFELVVQSARRSFSSGWQSFAFQDKTLKLGLSLPAALPEIADLYLRIEDSDRTTGEFAAIELRKIEIVSGERTTLDLDTDTDHVDPEALPQSGRRAGPRFARLKALNYNETENYALFEVTIEDLEFDGRVERAVKFKPSMANGRLSLEFRQGQNAPRVFREWPGRQQDRFGDVFRVIHTDAAVTVVGELTTSVDRELIAVLCRLIPTIVAASVPMLPNAVERHATWLNVSREFAAAAQRTFGTTA